MKSCCVGKKAENELKVTVNFLKLLAEENRLKIVCLIAQGELCVCDIWNALNIPQNLTSHHLKALKKAGLLASRKEGLNVYYSLDHDSLNSSRKLLDSFLTKHTKACCK